MWIHHLVLCSHFSFYKDLKLSIMNSVFQYIPGKGKQVLDIS